MSTINPRYVVDGHVTADEDSDLAGDGEHAPFRIFHPETQDYLPGKFATRAQAQVVTNLLNDYTLQPEPEPAPTKVWSCGWNIPGYLPDDEPMNFETWLQARDALLEALYQAAEDRAEDAPDQALDYTRARKYLEAVDADCNWSTRIGNYLWWVQRIVLPTDR